MSLGFVGVCKKFLEDDEMVIYTYAGENWNDGGKSKSGDSQLQDGIMIIDKRDLAKGVYEGLETGAVRIEKECKNAFRRKGAPVDYIAWRLLLHIFDYYEKNNSCPEYECFIQ